MKNRTIMIFIVAIFAYGYAIETHNYILETISKPIPVLLLIFQVRPRSRFQLFILLGLIFSLLGDILLLKNVDNFILGLASFLTAHILYIIAFLQRNNNLNIKSSLPFYGVAAGIILFLYPHLGSMKIPVIVYVIVIMTMAWRAYTQLRYNSVAFMGFAGAVLFAASDLNLAIAKFVHYYDHSKIVTIILYWTAQYLITQTAISEKNLPVKTY